jgi:hypothetical protein
MRTRVSFVVACGASLALTAHARYARGQRAPTPPPAYAYAPGYAPPAYGPPPTWDRGRPAPEQRSAPPAARGFQMALRFGLNAPFGNATAASGDTEGARYSDQFPLFFDLGAKLSDRVYVGGVFGFAIGTNGSDDRVESLCVDRSNDLNNDIVCTSTSVFAGVEAQYHFAPAARWNPWLGYGVGWEWANETIDDNVVGRSESTTASGFDFARLTGGVDWRAAKAFGLGPFLTFALGSNSSTRTDVNNAQTYDGAVSSPAIHGWVMFGLRLVLFP